MHAQSRTAAPSAALAATQVFAAPSDAARLAAAANAVLAAHARGKARALGWAPAAGPARTPAQAVFRLLHRPQDVTQLRLWCSLLLAAHHIEAEAGQPVDCAPFTVFARQERRQRAEVVVGLEELDGHLLHVPLLNLYDYGWLHVDPRGSRSPIDRVLDVGQLWACLPTGGTGSALALQMAAVLSHFAENRGCPVDRKLPLLQAANELRRAVAQAEEQTSKRSRQTAVAQRLLHRRTQSAGAILSGPVQNLDALRRQAREDYYCRVARLVSARGPADGVPVAGVGTNNMPVAAHVSPPGAAASAQAAVAHRQDRSASPPRLLMQSSLVAQASPTESGDDGDARSVDSAQAPSQAAAEVTWPKLLQLSPAALRVAFDEASAAWRHHLLATIDEATVRTLARALVAESVAARQQPVATPPAVDLLTEAMTAADGANAARQICGWAAEEMAPTAPQLAWTLVAALPRKQAEGLPAATVLPLLSEVPAGGATAAQIKLVDAWLRRSMGSPQAAAAMRTATVASLAQWMAENDLLLSIGRLLAATATTDAADEDLMATWNRRAVQHQAKVQLPVLDNVVAEHPMMQVALAHALNGAERTPKSERFALAVLLGRKLKVKRSIAAEVRQVTARVMGGLAVTDERIWPLLPWHVPLTWSVLDELPANQRCMAIAGGVAAHRVDYAGVLKQARAHVTSAVFVQLATAFLGQEIDNAAVVDQLRSPLAALATDDDPQVLDAMTANALHELVTLSISPHATDGGVQTVADSLYRILDAHAFFLPQLLRAGHAEVAAQVLLFAYLNQNLKPTTLDALRFDLPQRAGLLPCLTMLDGVHLKLDAPVRSLLTKSDMTAAKRAHVVRLFEAAGPSVRRFCASMLTHLSYTWARAPHLLADTPNSSTIVVKEVITFLLGNRQIHSPWFGQEAPVQLLVGELRVDKSTRANFATALLHEAKRQNRSVAALRKLLPGVDALLQACTSAAERRLLAEQFADVVLVAVERLRALPDLKETATRTRLEVEARTLMLEASSILQPALLDFSDTAMNAATVNNRRLRMYDAVVQASLNVKESVWRIPDAIVRNAAATGADRQEIVASAQNACRNIFGRLANEQPASELISHGFHWLTIARTVQQRMPQLVALGPAFVDAMVDVAKKNAAMRDILPLLYLMLLRDHEAPSTSANTPEDVAFVDSCAKRLLERAVADGFDLATGRRDLVTTSALRDASACADLSWRLATLLRYPPKARAEQVRRLCQLWREVAPEVSSQTQDHLDGLDLAFVDAEVRRDLLRALAAHGGKTDVLNADLVRRMLRMRPLDAEERELACTIDGVALIEGALKA